MKWFLFLLVTICSACKRQKGKDFDAELAKQAPYIDSISADNILAGDTGYFTNIAIPDTRNIQILAITN